MSWSFYPAEFLDGAQRETWEAVNQRHYAAHPLLDPKFVLPLCRHFPADRLFLAIERQRGEAISAALLASRGRGVWDVYTPAQAQLGVAMFARERPEGDCRESLDDLLHTLPGVAWLLGLTCQDPAYSGAFRTTSGAHTETLEHAHTINVEICGRFRDYWAARPRKLTSDVERIFRRLEREGVTATLTERRAPVDMPAAVAAHGALESAGWKGRHGTAIHRDNVQGRFYVEVMREFARANGARAYQLYFGDRLVASQLTVLQNGMMVLLKTAHDESMSHYSPGRLLDYKMLERLFAEPDLRFIEFYTNASKEDAKWCTGGRDICHINYYRSAALRRIARAVRRARRTSTAAAVAPEAG